MQFTVRVKSKWLFSTETVLIIVVNRQLSWKKYLQPIVESFNICKIQKAPTNQSSKQSNRNMDKNINKNKK